MTRIGKYEVVARIGQGTTSHVYKAYDPTLGRYVAVKTINVEANRDADQRRRFVREAQSVALLNHPRIVTLYDFGQDEDRLYIAMELLEGSDLRQALAEKRFTSLDQKLEVMTQVCEGIAHAHAHGVVHRDLKPANIHLLPNGQVKVMDFGLARLAGSDITRTGLVMGTPYYMSPEQVRGEHVDARSDVFALGCVLYELCTGQRAFEADSVHSVLYKVSEARPRPAQEWTPELPAVILEILARAMAGSPADRFPDASELRRWIARARDAIGEGRGHERLERDLPTQAEAVAPPSVAEPVQAKAPPAARSTGQGALRSKRKPVVPYALAAFLLLLAGAGAWLFMGRTAPPRAPDAMAGEFVATQIDLARKKLETGDALEAKRLAERALRVDPSSAAAKDLEDRALVRVRESARTALAATREALAAGNEAKARSMLWLLLDLAPDHPEVDQVLPALEEKFEAEAERARREMKPLVDGASGRSDLLREARARAKDGEAAFAAGRFASAAREFLRARTLYRDALE